MTLKFGRTPPDPRRPKLYVDDYLTSALPGVAGATDVDYASKVTAGSTGWPMYWNDTLGSCTCAAIGHMIQAWTAYAGKPEVTVPDNNVLDMYSAVSGYNPHNGQHDDGANMQDVLSYMNHTGIADSSGHVHKVAAYAALRDPTDVWQLARVLYTFGSAYIGINCPQSALDQYHASTPWTVVDGSPIAGGHAIPIQRRRPIGSSVGILDYITWAKEQKVTLGFHRKYSEEVWAVVTEDWIEANGRTVNGVSLNQLLSDMSTVT